MLAHPEAPVELVQGRSAKGTVGRAGERERRSDARKSRPIRGLTAVSERSGCAVSDGVAVETSGVRSEWPSLCAHTSRRPAAVSSSRGCAWNRSSTKAAALSWVPPASSSARRRPAEVARLVGDAADVASLETGDEMVASSEDPAPLAAESQSVRGHPLASDQPLALPVRGHRAEGLLELLGRSPQPQRPRPPVVAAGDEADPGVVFLEWGPVVAGLVVVHGPEKRTSVVPQPPLDGGVDGGVARGHGAVDGAAVRLVDGQVAVGAQGLCGQAPPPGPAGGVRGHDPVEEPRAAGAGLAFQAAPRAGPASEDLRDTAQGPAAVEVGGAAAEHLEPLHPPSRDAAPVHPCAEGIVEGKTVEEDQGPAGSARPEATQRHALDRGVGGAAAGPPEQAEAHHLPERVVDGRRGGGVEGATIEHGHARRGVSGSRVAARRGDRHLVDEPWRGGWAALGRGRVGLGRRHRDNPDDEGGGPRGEARKTAQGTVTATSTSAVPRRHQASRTEQ